LALTVFGPAPGPTQTPYPMGTEGLFPEGQAADGWSWPLTSILCPG